MKNKEQELIDAIKNVEERMNIDKFDLNLNSNKFEYFELIWKLEGFRLGVAEEKAKHEKFVEELLKIISSQEETDLDFCVWLRTEIGRLQEKYK